MNLVQESSINSHIDAEDKLSILEPYPLTRCEVRQKAKPLKAVEKMPLCRYFRRLVGCALLCRIFRFLCFFFTAKTSRRQ